MPSAATGSAHHQPSAALSPMPASVISDSHQQAVVWNESASIARLPRSTATRRLARASHRIATIDTAVMTTPARVGSGRSPPIEIPRRFDGHVAREQEERQPDELVRSAVEPLHLLAVTGVLLGV